MKILILEDEPAAANQLKFLLSQLNFPHEILAVIETIGQGIHWFTTNEKPDLIFSDIQLADGLSFEIFEQIQIQSPIIFTTAFDEFAIRAFKLNSVDYILKPISLEAVNFALQKLKNQEIINNIRLNDLIKSQVFSQKSYRKSFLVRYRNKLLPIKTSEFGYFYIENGLVYGQLLDGRRLALDFKLEDLESQLDPNDFVRANRQFIISRESILEILPIKNSRVLIKTNPASPYDAIISKEKVSFIKNWFLKG